MYFKCRFKLEALDFGLLLLEFPIEVPAPTEVEFAIFTSQDFSPVLSLTTKKFQLPKAKNNRTLRIFFRHFSWVRLKVAKLHTVFEIFTQNKDNVGYFDDVNGPSLFQLIEAFFETTLRVVSSCNKGLDIRNDTEIISALVGGQETFQSAQEK